MNKQTHSHRTEINNTTSSPRPTKDSPSLPLSFLRQPGSESWLLWKHGVMRREINTPAEERASRSHGLWWAFLQNFLHCAQSQQFGRHRQDQGRCRGWIHSKPIHVAWRRGGSEISFPWGAVSVFLQDKSSKAEVVLFFLWSFRKTLGFAQCSRGWSWHALALSWATNLALALSAFLFFGWKTATEKQTWESSSHLKSLEELTCFLFLLYVS